MIILECTAYLLCNYESEVEVKTKEIIEVETAEVTISAVFVVPRNTGQSIAPMTGER